ncbi:copper chaperone PCu(A)C [Povalibacter sp.]|uniref:copper chaperone PCu(A)C n=1 Tax=Povalibacter sp. TaxID=1962978 RepID=UPI002F405EC9
MLNRRALLFAAALLTLTACGQTQPPTVVVNAWSPAAPPGATVVAVYGEISARQDDVLLRIAAPSATSAELHETSEENGMMKMRPVTRLELKAGTPVQLAPGGMHVMLMGMQEAFAPGAQIPITFEFEQAGEVSVMAQVK